MLVFVLCALYSVFCIRNHTNSSSIWNLFAGLCFSKSIKITGKCSLSCVKKKRLQINSRFDEKSHRITFYNIHEKIYLPGFACLLGVVVWIYHLNLRQGADLPVP